MFRGLRRALVGLAAVLTAGVAGAGPSIQDLQLESEAEGTRVVLELTEVPEYRVFTLSDPDRVVIDLEAGELAASSLPSGGVLEGVRSGRQEGGGLRVVLDLERSVQTRSYVIGGAGGGERLVVDLQYGAAGAERPEDEAPEREPRDEPVRTLADVRDEVVTVAIDPGHGGVDPGAVGPEGTTEKEIALSVSRKLADRMAQAEGLEPVLIRDGDYYLGLRDRTRKAREAEADIFLSIHADGAENPNVKGASVYALSLDGATSEQARALAQRENAADMLGGLSLEGRDDHVSSAIVDLQSRGVIEASLEMGDRLLPEIDQQADLLHDRVEQAGFAVLKSLDMPSLLIELGFITNPAEERRLNDPGYQRDLAEGILRGVESYAEQRLRPEMRMAAEGRGGDTDGTREHTVERGETLSHIAQRYQVSTERLRAANDLSGDHLRAGKTLVIP